MKYKKRQKPDGMWVVYDKLHNQSINLTTLNQMLDEDDDGCSNMGLGETVEKLVLKHRWGLPIGFKLFGTRLHKARFCRLSGRNCFVFALETFLL